MRVIRIADDNGRYRSLSRFGILSVTGFTDSNRIAETRWRPLRVSRHTQHREQTSGVDEGNVGKAAEHATAGYTAQ